MALGAVNMASTIQNLQITDLAAFVWAMRIANTIAEYSAFLALEWMARHGK